MAFMKFSEVGEMLAEMVLKGDTMPWRKPWNEGLLGWRSIGGYRLGGVYNNLIYNIAAQNHGSRWFGNSRQTFKHKLFAPKGAKMVEVLKPIFKKVEEKDPTTGAMVKTSRLIGFSTACLWNMGQIPGFDPAKFEKDDVKLDFHPIEKIDAAVQEYCRATGVKMIETAEPRAYYSPGEDLIHMPLKTSFESVGAYYDTVFHELCHATKGNGRIDRSLSYAAEELAAEFGSSMLAGFFGIDWEPEQSAAYIKTWKDRISSDPKVLTDGMGAGVKAAKFFLEKAGIELPAEQEWKKPDKDED